MDTTEVQKRIYTNKVNKGFNVTNIDKEFCYLYGEVGEAYEAWRKKEDGLGSELADIAIYLLGLAEILQINLGDEVARKIEINEKRTYQVIDGVNTRIGDGL